MSTSLARPCAGRVSLPYARWAALAAALGAEVVTLSLWFDRPEPGADAWWPLRLFSFWVIRLAPAAAVTMFVFGGLRLLDVLRSRADDLGQRVWPPLLGHLAAFAVFARLTAVVVGQPGSGWGMAVWAVLWAATGAAALALWLAAALPVGLWGALARRGAGAALTGLAVAVLACTAGQWTRALWDPFYRSTFAMARALVGLFCRDVVCRPAEYLIGTPSYAVVISPACSGYEGIGLVWAFLGAYLWLDRRSLRFPAVLWLLPAGTAAIWLANAVRIAALVAVGTFVSPEVASQGFHSQSGWLAFNAVCLALVALARSLGLFSKRVDSRVELESGTNRVAAYLGPGMALLASTLVTAAFSGGGFDALYPVRVAATALALWYGARVSLGGVDRGSWAAVGLGALAFAAWVALEPLPTGISPAPLALSALPPGLAVAWLALRVFGSVVTVPIAEEMAFRGYLARRLVAADFEAVAPGRITAASALVSSLLFGALHQRWLAGAVAGLLFALAYRRRGRLSDAVLAHATANALIAACVLCGGRWHLWV